MKITPVEAAREKAGEHFRTYAKKSNREMHKSAPKVGGRAYSIFLLTLFAAQFAKPALAQSDATTTIQLVWTEVVDRISPNPLTGIITHKNMTVTLRGGNQVSQTSDNRSGRFSSSSARSTQLGMDWRVVSENVLVRTDNYPNHARVMTVRVDGRSSCSLSVAHELKAGQTSYRYPMISRPGQVGSYSRIATQSASCSIK